MRLATRAALAAITVIPLTAAAGDYSLNVDDRLGECRSVGRSYDVCGSAIVVSDLERRFVQGKPFRIPAVDRGFTSCRVWFAGAAERTNVYAALATLVVRTDVANERELLDAVGCFPFGEMRASLDAEILKEHPPQVRDRLHRARTRIQSKSKEIRG
jgi:hypothetical protein